MRLMSNRSIRHCVLLSIAAIAIVVWPASGRAQRAPTDLEHFQCYPLVNATPVPQPASLFVGLSDQFGKEEHVLVGTAKRFCVATTKLHDGTISQVEDPNQHLMLYATAPEVGPRRIVAIRNQFGRQKLLVREPVALAVPTQKLVPGNHVFPVGLDHFRCYAARGNEVNQKVGLNDQFSSALQGHLVLDPVLFCNPVEKTAPAGVFKINHPDAHLACYGMTRVPFQGITEISNQVEPFALYNLFPADLLCAPTTKLGVEEVPDFVPGTVPRLTQSRD